MAAMESEDRKWVTRFAPSPTGHLHLGHAYAAWTAWREARASDGRYLLRWEDIDGPRCRKEYEASILEDLHWLGLDPDEEPVRQSERKDVYAEVLDRLEALKLVYPCFCSRREIRDEWERMAAAPHGSEGPLYTGRCRRLSRDEAARRMRDGDPWALRLLSEKAIEAAGRPRWADRKRGVQEVDLLGFGDLVLGRKDVATSFHLAVTVDDAQQGVSLVTRGDDLFDASGIHRVLQCLLELPEPLWQHHGLVCDSDGRRLAKRDAALSLRELRRRGAGSGHVQELLEAMRCADEEGDSAAGWEIAGTRFRFRAGGGREDCGSGREGRLS
ncbi:MAG TPA: tRNA glutamyl-Q(34) synthetase GluQRS [Verrucomicrobiales bacterium]|nr:tRNA glutamyl-Q(34) synthetase GluQRS [Verrucomicrobiales bacterium]